MIGMYYLFKQLLIILPTQNYLLTMHLYTNIINQSTNKNYFNILIFVLRANYPLVIGQEQLVPQISILINIFTCLVKGYAQTREVLQT